MNILDKITEARGEGHGISAHLEEILVELDARLTALEPKKAETKKEGAETKPDFDELNRGQKYDPVVKTGD